MGGDGLYLEMLVSVGAQINGSHSGIIKIYAGTMDWEIGFNVFYDASAI